MIIIILLLQYLILELLGAFLNWMFETPVKGEKNVVKKNFKW